MNRYERRKTHEIWLIFSHEHLTRTCIYSAGHGRDASRTHIQSVNSVIRLNYLDAAVATVHTHSNKNQCNSHFVAAAAASTADGNGTCSRLVISGIADLVALFDINKSKLYMRNKKKNANTHSMPGHAQTNNSKSHSFLFMFSASFFFRIRFGSVLRFSIVSLIV